MIEDRSEACRLEQVRRDFVANAADGLRRPMAAVEALVGLLPEGGGHQVARRLASAVGAMTQTVDDLVELARLETDEPGRWEPIPASVLVADAAGAATALARRRRVDVRIGEVDPDLMIAGRSRQLVSALSKLIENAINHSGECQPVVVDTVAAGRHVDLIVRDRGVGVAEQDAERIFETFYRGARSGEAAGAGLGLAMVRHVAARHGGTVLVDSRAGEGTAFVLRLPQAITSAPPR